MRTKCEQDDDTVDKFSEIFERRRLIRNRALGMNIPSPDSSPTKIETVEIELPTSPTSPRKQPRTLFQRYLQKPENPKSEEENPSKRSVKRGRPFIKSVENRDIKLTNYGKHCSRRHIDAVF